MTTASTSSPRIATWRHVRAIALLPFMNTVVIPGVLLAVWPPAPLAAAARLALAFTGIVVFVCGVALVAHSIRLFVQLGRGTLAPWDPTRELVTAGAYRYSRNPMKGGLFLVLAGEALVTQSPALAVWFACFALVNTLYIRLHEEPKLTQRFGDRYRDYCAQVPRWWPSLRATHAAEAAPK
jgi:protein-S-isoprenylcysteine O-methyltransferase Ste14